MTSFIIVDDRDNVATAVQDIAKGEVVDVQTGDSTSLVALGGDIPSGHKFALKSIPVGHHVIKYGETIGAASQPIAPGDHVHVHNVEGMRGRGDRA